MFPVLHTAVHPDSRFCSGFPTLQIHALHATTSTQGEHGKRIICCLCLLMDSIFCDSNLRASAVRLGKESVSLCPWMPCLTTWEVGPSDVGKHCLRHISSSAMKIYRYNLAHHIRLYLQSRTTCNRRFEQLNPDPTSTSFS